jgi:hypothetical protein
MLSYGIRASVDEHLSNAGILLQSRYLVTCRFLPHRCRALLRDELGTSPSPETQALYLTLLRM